MGDFSYESSQFSRATAEKRHLYSREGPAGGHRRTTSSTTESFKAFNGRGGAHRRTLSNTALDFNRIMSSSPTMKDIYTIKEVPSPPVERSGGLTELPEETCSPDSLNSPELPRKEKSKQRGFLSFLDTAITYFTSVGPEELPDENHNPTNELHSIRMKHNELEKCTSSLKAECNHLKTALQQQQELNHKYEDMMQLLMTKATQLEHKLTSRNTGAPSLDDSLEKDSIVSNPDSLESDPDTAKYNSQASRQSNYEVHKQVVLSPRASLMQPSRHVRTKSDHRLRSVVFT